MRHPFHRRTGIHLLASASLFCLTACADTPAIAEAEPAKPTTLQTAAQVMVDPVVMVRSFDDWRADFRAEALAQGIDPQLFDRAFAGVTPDPDVIKADRSQPEFSRPVWTYLEGALSNQRVSSGQRKLDEQRTQLDRIEQRYGVDKYILAAIWGLESNFGQNMGNRQVIRSLATLAHEGRRPTFAHDQWISSSTATSSPSECWALGQAPWGRPSLFPPLITSTRWISIRMVVVIFGTARPMP